MRSLIDSLAERILDLRTVSASQWLLRLVPLVALAAGLFAVFPAGPLAGFLGTLVALVLGGAALVQVVVPDSDVGLLAGAALLVALVPQGDLTAWRALAVGVALLIAHVGWSLAAMLPAHGVFSASAWTLAGRAVLVVLLLTAAGAAVVLTLGTAQFGPWMVVPGALAVIALVAGLLWRSGDAG